MVKDRLEAVISRRTGETRNPHVYSCNERCHRSLSVYLLLDISESTKEKEVGSDNTVLELERTPGNGVACYIISMATQTKSKTD